MDGVGKPLCTDLAPLEVPVDREVEIFDAFVKGDSLDVIAVKLGIPYVDCANAIQHRIAAAQMERRG